MSFMTLIPTNLENSNMWVGDREVECEWRNFVDADGQFLCIVDYDFICEEVNERLGYGDVDLEDLGFMWTEDKVWDQLFCDIWRSNGARPDSDLVAEAMVAYQRRFVDSGTQRVGEFLDDAHAWSPAAG